MSFIHYTVVGHFDPATLFHNRPLMPTRPLEESAVVRLLAKFPSEVQEYVELAEGFVTVHWAPCHMKCSEAVHRFAYDLAEQERCIAAESPFYYIMYPSWAQQAQMEAVKALTAKG